mmetsp:Transcript_23539/g.58935  ORF Transcript_23539/g.58935 Transcript_23539/m.58935 type:complete len:200 (+) Transcript_23539:519-1118(+)
MRPGLKAKLQVPTKRGLKEKVPTMRVLRMKPGMRERVRTTTKELKNHGKLGKLATTKVTKRSGTKGKRGMKGRLLPTRNKAVSEQHGMRVLPRTAGAPVRPRPRKRPPRWWLLKSAPHTVVAGTERKRQHLSLPSPRRTRCWCPPYEHAPTPPLSLRRFHRVDPYPRQHRRRTAPSSEVARHRSHLDARGHHQSGRRRR